MSASHRRLFEASLAALLLAQCDEEGLSATVPAPGQWNKSMDSNKIRADAEALRPDGRGRDVNPD
jgi:hypothetical protein